MVKSPGVLLTSCSSPRTTAKRGSRAHRREVVAAFLAVRTTPSISTDAAAIAAAIEMARRGDIVVVAGKGHETTQQFANTTVRFDDREVVREELARLGRGKESRGERSDRDLHSGGVALLVAGFGTPLLMRWLTRRQIGQQIREDGPPIHAMKAGTPTMGGIAMIAAVVCGYLLSHLGTHEPMEATGALAVAGVVAAGAIGLADDWLKVRRRRSLGLNKRAKLGLQIAVGIAFCIASLHWAHYEHEPFVHAI